MRSLLALLLFTGLAVSLPARHPYNAAHWEKHSFLRGTGFETEHYTAAGEDAYPVAFIIAPHPDERSAGLYLRQLIERGRVLQGRVVLMPDPVRLGWDGQRRYVIEDLNRKFGPFADTHTPLAQIARYVQHLVRSYDVSLILNLHEGWGKFSENWQLYGHCFIIDTPALFPLTMRVANQVNRGLDPGLRFLIAYKPMSTTLTFWGRQQGIQAIGVEVARELNMRLKVSLQHRIVSEFLKDQGIIIRMD